MRFTLQRDLQIIREYRFPGGLVHGTPRGHGDRRLNALTARMEDLEHGATGDRLAVEFEVVHTPPYAAEGRNTDV